MTLRAMSDSLARLCALVLASGLGGATTGCTCDSSIGEAADTGTRMDAYLDPTIDADLDGAVACPRPGELMCDGLCLDTSVDPDHCGDCETVCSADEACLSGGCVADCPEGLAECGRQCVETRSDDAHCGGCGNECPGGEGCVDGTCVPEIPLGPAPARCAGGGPPIEIGASTSAICLGAVSSLTFTRGLCTCRDVGVPVLGSDLLVDAYDSAIGPYVERGPGGSLAANGALQLGSSTTVTGDAITAAASGFRVRPETHIEGSLEVSGDLTLEGVLEVGGDARVGGAISGGSDSTIGGTLTTPDCAGVPGTLTRASCVEAPVVVEAPCACGDTERLPIAAIVDFYADPARSDGAALGLAPDALVAPSGPTRLDLPCGHYYLQRIEVSAPTTIVAHGRTALFIGGSVTASAPLTLMLDPGATLDVFVAGDVDVDALRVGTPAYPRQSRVYVGGAVSVGSETDLAGLFYAPNGLFEASSSLEMYGAIFAGDYHSSSNTRIHYDLASTRTDEDCPPPPPADGGLPDAGQYVCPFGSPLCGPGQPACAAQQYCVTGCCVELQ